MKNPIDFVITDRTSVECLLLPYLFHILEFYRVYGNGNSAATRNFNDDPRASSKGFSIAPVCKIKRHFMTIDTNVSLSCSRMWHQRQVPSYVQGGWLR